MLEVLVNLVNGLFKLAQEKVWLGELTVLPCPSSAEMFHKHFDSVDPDQTTPDLDPDFLPLYLKKSNNGSKTMQQTAFLDYFWRCFKG